MKWVQYAQMVNKALDADSQINFDTEGKRLREPHPVQIDPRDLKYLLSYVPSTSKLPSAVRQGVDS